jgi:hypothetical protein
MAFARVLGTMKAGSFFVTGINGQRRALIEKVVADGHASRQERQHGQGRDHAKQAHDLAFAEHVDDADEGESESHESLVMFG